MRTGILPTAGRVVLTAAFLVSLCGCGAPEASPRAVAPSAAAPASPDATSARTPTGQFEPTLLPGTGPALGSATRTSPFGGNEVPPDDPSGQLVARGSVVNEAWVPMGNVPVYLVVGPSQDAMHSLKPGEPLPETGVLWTRTDADGSFAIHLRPTGAVLTTIRANGDFANFTLYAMEGDATSGYTSMGMWGFPLHLSGALFDQLPDPITIKVTSNSPVKPPTAAPS